MGGWMEKWIHGLMMNGCVRDEWKKGWMHGWMNGWMFGCIYEHMEFMSVWADGQMGGVCTYVWVDNGCWVGKWVGDGWMNVWLSG